MTPYVPVFCLVVDITHTHTIAYLTPAVTELQPFLLSLPTFVGRGGQIAPGFGAESGDAEISTGSANDVM